jgi:hypothetical protein
MQYGNQTDLVLYMRHLPVRVNFVFGRDFVVCAGPMRFLETGPSPAKKSKVE